MLHSARSATGNHDLLPANNKDLVRTIPRVPVHDLSAWTFSSGTVIWRIWPAVLIHTIFAAGIVVISRKTKVDLGVPNVLITLLGVVIGFVISLRVSSAYDRYWWGRCAWSDIVKTTRTISRLIWINTPARITKPSDASSPGTPSAEIGQAMREKRIALELLEAFAVSLKHHLRGELGIYYEDLYPIVRPLHEHHAHENPQTTQPESSSAPRRNKRRAPTRHLSIETYAQSEASQSHATDSNPPKSRGSRQDSLLPSMASVRDGTTADPVISAINEYGHVKGPIPRHKASYSSIVSTDSSAISGEREPLLPSALPGPEAGASIDLIPFTSVVSNIGYYLDVRRWFRAWRENWRKGFEGSDQPGGVAAPWADSQQEGPTTSPRGGWTRHRRSTRQMHNQPGKHRPLVAGDGENLPLEILRCLSEWLCVLEARGTVGGNALGGMFSCITSFEDSLSTLERILTTPLPFVYSVHISTVWLYLFFLPFQLTDDFNWYTIPGTAVAAFFYLGFIAAGEEIEQPFGYDDNDLNLDLFCRDLIKADLHTLTSTPFPNAPMDSHHAHGEIYEASTVVEISQRKKL